jgi:hypothetical protein
MSLFYFNLRGGIEEYDDDEGCNFSDLEAAYRCAQTIARNVIDEATAQGEFVDLGQRYEIYNSNRELVAVLLFRSLIMYH